MKSFSKLAGASAIAMCALLLVGCDDGVGSNSEYFKNIDLLPVQTSKDGKWSMINDKGEIVYDSEFKNTPSAAYNGFFSVANDKGLYTVYKVSDKKPDPVKGLEDLASVGYFEEGLIPAAPEKSRISLYNEKGEKKFELSPIADVEITNCGGGFSEGRLLIVNADSKYGYVNTKGEAVIKPQYDSATDFEDGMAIVGKTNDDKSGMTISVIDTDGKLLFKLKDDYSLRGFQSGYVIAEKEDRIYLYNKKGEDIKLPAKVRGVTEIVDKYFIFYNEDYQYGVANLDGEILINPKYSSLTFDKKGFFFVSKPTFIGKKDREDKEVVRIDLDGEKVGEPLDYTDIMPIGKFGYLAKDGENTAVLLDKDLKKVGKEDFYGISPSLCLTGGVTSDYFNYDGVAGIVADLVNGSSVGDYKLGSRPSAILKGETPGYSNSYSSVVKLDKLDKKGFRYNITAEGYFNSYLATYNFNPYTYSGSYTWNPNASLSCVGLKISAEKEWGKEGQDALIKALVKKGFKELKSGQSKYNSDELVAVLTKGNVGIQLNSTKNGYSGNVIVYQEGWVDSKSSLEYIVPVTGNGDNRAVADYPVEEAIVTDTAVVATGDYYGYY